MDLTFTLNQAEAQTVLEALVQQPYGVVAPVVDKIQAQAAEQMRPQQDTATQEDPR